MATTAQVDAALAKLRSARVKLFEVTSQRNDAMLRRTRMTTTVTELNAAVTAARAAVATARTEAAAMLAETEVEQP